MVKFWRYGLLTLCCVLVVSISAAAKYNLSAQQQTRFVHLTKHLRCLVCQNETLDASDAALANDLRAQIALRIQNGQTNDQIIKFLVGKYGDFILYTPPFRPATYLLWLGPLGLLLIGALIAVLVIRKHKRHAYDS